MFRHGQMLTCIGLGLSHGTNDSQKTMGIITLGLVSAGVIPNFDVPLWVIAVSAAAISFGTMLGGWRLIRTVGGRMYTVRAVHGFTAHIASTIVIMGAALLGDPSARLKRSVQRSRRGRGRTNLQSALGRGARDGDRLGADDSGGDDRRRGLSWMIQLAYSVSDEDR